MEKEHLTPESQIRASMNYRKRVNSDEVKKAHRNYMTSMRSAKSFINTKATLEELAELELLIAERKNQLPV